MEVFFSGRGYWSTYIHTKERDDDGRPYFSDTRRMLSRVCGVFEVDRSGEIEYRHTKTLNTVEILYACSTHSDKVVSPGFDWDEFWYENRDAGICGGYSEDDFVLSSYFKIDRSYTPWTLDIAQPDKHHQAESEDEVRLSKKETVNSASIEVSKDIRECRTLLVYYEGKGLWFDFPSVDSPKRSEAWREWVKNFRLPIWGSLSDDEWNKEYEKYSENLKEWEANNPPPKHRVVETEIFLEPDNFFDFSVPVLHYQPEEACVSAVFKLKANDERQLRYKGQVTVSTLLPCDHPDGDSSGFFFQLDEPCTFTKNDIKFDEQVEAPQKEALEFLNLSMAAERTGYTVEYLVCLACEGKLPLYFRQNGTEAYVTEYGLSYYPDEYGARVTDAQIITRDVLVLTKPYQIPVETIQRYHNDRNTCLYSFINPDYEKCEEIQTHFEKSVPMRKIVKLVSAEDVERLRKSNVAAKITKLTQPHPLINNGKASQDKSIVDVQPSQPKGQPINKNPANWQDDDTLLKSDKQVIAILEVIKSMENPQYEALSIPDGGKAKIKKTCEEKYPSLFDGNESFNNAWKKARNDNIVKMANHASYAKMGKLE